MLLHRVLADNQLLCDRGVRSPFGDQRKDLAFPGTESLHSRVIVQCPGLNQ